MSTDYSNLPRNSAELCRERIEHWKQLLEQATLRAPLDKTMREAVVAKCVDRIAVWNRRLKRITREEAA